jgi:protein-tyrosine phosphatase
MIDLHSHVLPGLDDGSPDLESSLDICRMAVADGITDMVATPHYRNGVGVRDIGAIPPAADLLRKALAENGIPLALHVAIEMPLLENYLELYRDGTWLAYDPGRKYILLECPPLPINGAQVLSRVVDALLRAGAIPILAHPERLPFLDRIEDVIRLRRQGALFQVTAGALAMHSSSGHRAREWLDRDIVSFVATDTHGTNRRPPILSEPRDFIRARCGAAVAEALTNGNARKVLDGLPLA